MNKHIHNDEIGSICITLSFNMTVDERQYYYVPEKMEKMYLSIFPHHTFKINLQNNHISGD